MFLSFLFIVLLPFQDIDLSNSTENIEVVDADYYSVIAATDKMYGTNYTLNVRVEANCFYGSCTIRGVEVATNYCYQSVSYRSEFGRASVYSFRYNGDQYYFTFK